ncbi:hypothetical protein LguiB_000250 [Lonicera macranthoides]
MYCYCCIPTIVRTSWTDNNPGRRFRACEQGVCGYFSWVDPPMCKRSKEIIPGLLRKKNQLEDEVMKYKARDRFLIVLLLISWFCIALLFISYPENV